MLDETSRKEGDPTFGFIFDELQELFDGFWSPSEVISERAAVDAHLKLISLRGPGKPVREVCKVSWPLSVERYDLPYGPLPALSCMLVTS